jgi:hypothetical protein
MAERWQGFDTDTETTDEHRTDQEHLQRCWDTDPDVLSAWQLRYLFALDARLGECSPESGDCFIDLGEALCTTPGS